ncbi:MAG: DUF542 domain-containing protein [Acidobacteria bacterium]|nr:DUF542 domain-containing protein [Acidobacteriota bacterium]
MDITADTTLMELVNDAPATIPVLQRHAIHFCCGGRVAVREICENEQLDLDAFLDELRAAVAGFQERDDWHDAPIDALIVHILERYHAHHREDLPRLDGMLDKVVERHGDTMGETLGKLQTLFGFMADALSQHMRREEAVLFPAIAAAADRPEAAAAFPIREAIDAMEREHRRVEWAMEQIRVVTDRFTPPDGACATFRGLYHGLGEFDRLLDLHVHLEDDILFRRALGLTPAPRR